MTSEDKQGLPDTIEDWFFLFIGIGMGLTILNYLAINMIPLFYTLSTSDNSNISVISFSKEQYSRISNDYKHKQYEIAYCMVIQKDGRVKTLFTADIIQSNKTEVVFRCPKYSNGILHTHPPTAKPTPSKTDIENTRNIGCVYHTVTLTCWKNSSVGFKPLKVVIQDAS